MSLFSSRTRLHHAVLSVSALILLTVAASSPRAQPARPAASAASARVPVLVELFTSEGCSSCPPADIVLTTLIEKQPITGAEVIGLGFHVDYWDHQGWRDRFSSRMATARQNAYASSWSTEQIYTPQMVVNGARQFVGNDPRAAVSAIEEAIAQPRAQVSVLHEAGAVEGRVVLRVAVAPLAQLASKAEVWLAITEDGLVSDVQRGENARRKLAHAAVVRTFDRIGTADSASGLSLDRNITLDRGWRRETLKAVVLVQDGRSRRVLGAAVRPLS
jgi:hypothetical protein